MNKCNGLNVIEKGTRCCQFKTEEKIINRHTRLQKGDDLPLWCIKKMLRFLMRAR